METAGASEIARRCRGTPRIANRLLRRVRDYALVRGRRVKRNIAEPRSDLEVDPLRLEQIDHQIMLTVLEKYTGGPVGLEPLAASFERSRTPSRTYTNPT